MKKFYLLALTLLTTIFVTSFSGVRVKANITDKFHREEVEAFGTTNTMYIDKEDPLANNFRKYFKEGRDIIESLYFLSDNVYERSGDFSHNVFYINNNPNKLIEIDKRLYDIINMALDIQKLTDGYFDVSIGKIIDGWKEIIENKGYDEEYQYTKQEIDEKIKQIKKIPVIENGIELTEANGVYFIKILEGVKIDLGAITKGYAVQKVYDHFKSIGLKYFHITGSASSLLYGEKNELDTNKYKIRITNPYYLDELSWLEKILGNYRDIDIYGSIKVSNTAITTSGDTEQSAKHGNMLLHHIISPKTKQPENFYRVVSIIHPDAGYSDAITTALFSMDDKTFNDFIEKTNKIPKYKLSGYISFNFNKKIVENLNNEFELHNKESGDDILKTTSRDFIIISAIVIIAAIGLYMFSNAYKKVKHDFAIIYYKDQEIVKINYKEKKVEITLVQSDTLYDEVTYPIIDTNNQTIRILAAPQDKLKGKDDFIISELEDGRVRYELVIKYNLEKHSIEVIQEICEDQIAMSHGEVSGFGVSCIPSQVTVKFASGSGNDDFDGEI